MNPTPWRLYFWCCCCVASDACERGDQKTRDRVYQISFIILGCVKIQKVYKRCISHTRERDTRCNKSGLEYINSPTFHTFLTPVMEISCLPVLALFFMCSHTHALLYGIPSTWKPVLALLHSILSQSHSAFRPFFPLNLILDSVYR